MLCLLLLDKWSQIAFLCFITSACHYHLVHLFLSPSFQPEHYLGLVLVSVLSSIVHNVYSLISLGLQLSQLVHFLWNTISRQASLWVLSLLLWSLQIFLSPGCLFQALTDLFIFVGNTDMLCKNTVKITKHFLSACNVADLMNNEGERITSLIAEKQKLESYVQFGFFFFWVVSLYL